VSASRSLICMCISCMSASRSLRRGDCEIKKASPGCEGFALADVYVHLVHVYCLHVLRVYVHLVHVYCLHVLHVYFAPVYYLHVLYVCVHLVLVYIFSGHGACTRYCSPRKLHPAKTCRRLCGGRPLDCVYGNP